MLQPSAINAAVRADSISDCAAQHWRFAAMRRSPLAMSKAVLGGVKDGFMRREVCNVDDDGLYRANNSGSMKIIAYDMTILDF